MGFTVEQECPQCGAPVELDETDHLLRCPYCDVNSFLFAEDYFRFVLPSKAPNRDLIYLPYLRFKGSAFSCDSHAVRHRIVDITHLGVPFKRFPVSLGLRPQAMKMRFVNKDTKGSFLKCLLKTSDLLALAERHSSASDIEKVFHRAYIGEAMNLIYLPMYVEKEILFDGIINRPIAKLPKDRDIFFSIIDKNPCWGLTFLATLCPRCGWNLEGERDSVVMTCSNCETAWEAKRGRFVKVNLHIAAGGQPNHVYLPFWKMAVKAKGMEINSYADFMRATNQPKVMRKEWENQDMSFWSPAFKIRPKAFLDLSRRLTVAQTELDVRGEFPKKNIYPTTLPLSEAIQGIKVILAGCTITKKKVMPLLPDIRFSIRSASLVYLPFEDTFHEMVQPHTHIGINKKSLEFGRYL